MPDPLTIHTQGKPRFYYGYVVVAAAFILMFVLMGSYFSFGIFIKPLIAEFGWTRGMTSSPFSFSWVVGGFAGLLLGILNDRLGPRIVFSLAGILAGAGYLLMPLATNIMHLYIFYGVLIGLGCNVFVPVMSVIARIFSRRRTVMSGIATVGAGLGSLVMPPLLTQMVETRGLTTSFIVLGIATLVITIPASQFLRQDIMEDDGEGGSKQRRKPLRNLLLVEQSLTLRQAVKTLQFWLILIMLFFFGFCIFVMQVHIVPYVTDLGIANDTAALILATIGGASIVSRVVLGTAGDRIGNSSIMVFGFVLMLAAVLLLLVWENVLVFFIFATIFGIAYGDCAAQESPIVASIFGIKSHGVILGMLGFGFTLGAAVGPVVAGYLFDLTGSYHIANIATAVSAGIAVVTTALIRPVKGAEVHSMESGKV